MLTRIDCQADPVQCLYYPLIALVVQGRKQAFYGEREISYAAGEYVVLGNDMPGAYHIVDSSPEHPFLSISIRLDPKIITSLILDDHSASSIGQNSENPAIAKEIASCDLLLAFYRLLRLLASPETIPLFAPSLIREIHYSILHGKHGKKIRLAVIPGTRDNRIAQSIAWMREHFRESFSMPELAHNAGMAPATFNRYFREVTSISPLQFQKRLRLYEAQRLMFMENLDARCASAIVGYESEAQFSREYKRLFGQPPAQDAARSHR
ncbi:MAG: AraC family transcriptional regulator [Desulfovibrio sp.]|nr:AraC family transcriptional regulator [Desulfovibrio sp.]